MDALPVTIVGICGRMGQQLVGCLQDTADMTLAGGLTRSGSPRSGQPVPHFPDVLITDQPTTALANAAVVVDFSSPAALLELLPHLEEAGLPLVTGTTGLDAAQRHRLELAAQRIPIVAAANMSLGVNVLLELVQQAAQLLGPGYDLEVFEIHHRHKKDSPSGTAVALAQAGLRGRGAEDGPWESSVNMRGVGLTGPRRGAGEVGVSSARGGDVVGEHRVLLLNDGEVIELTHRATDRLGFARGALKAARWLVGKKPGLYSMRDVLGMG